MKKTFQHSIFALWGGIPSKCLKGCSLGILATIKMGLVLFWGTLKFCKLVKIDRGENV